MVPLTIASLLPDPANEGAVAAEEQLIRCAAPPTWG